MLRTAPAARWAIRPDQRGLWNKPAVARSGAAELQTSMATPEPPFQSAKIYSKSSRGD